jgi:hypothetical protein
MSSVLVMWIVWGGLVAITLALHIYRGSLQRDEDDQIFLDDSFEQEKAAQEVIVAKVNKVESPLLIMKWVVLVATVVAVGFSVWDMYSHFQ